MTISAFFKKIFSPIILGNCLGVIVATGLLVFAALCYVDCYTKHGESVLVPNLRGHKIEDIEKKLAALGLRCEVADTGYVDTYKGGIILDQDIAEGRRVKEGRVIKLTINASSARAIKLPQLAENSSHREAEAKLRALGFKNIRIEYIEGYQDWVYGIKANGKEVGYNTALPTSTTITLIVGDGKLKDEFNGNDTLDYIYFHEENEILEAGGGEGYGELGF